MATDYATAHIAVEELSETEAWSIFDAEARREFNMSGVEFEEQVRAGKFDDADDPRVARLAMLYPRAW
ncbi:hypothetical protein [Saccharothrix saharensis]|uniref:hypothetical protein n=1 Tax=Saccharothrix saharensis TaxID=571190 RepID=UPI001151073E|nr:hypothetical protein [Saccharothrix saharensis]